MQRGGSKPGERRGGRQKGTPNKRTHEVTQRLAEMGCDPIEGMARIAMNKKHSPELRGRMYAELAQYVYPKRKAVEHSGPEGDAIHVELVQRLQSARERMQGLSNESGKPDG